jgi:hypothetical protein
VASRSSELVTERGELLKGGGCIAVSWPVPGLTGAIACVGLLADIEADHAYIERALRAATVPGATRKSIVAAAGQR